MGLGRMIQRDCDRGSHTSAFVGTNGLRIFMKRSGAEVLTRRGSGASGGSLPLSGGGEAVGVAFAGEEGLDVGDFFCEGSILVVGVGGAAFIEGGDHEGSAGDADVCGACAGEGEVAFTVGADGVAIEFFGDVDLAFSGAGFDGDAFVGGADGVEGGGGDGVGGGGGEDGFAIATVHSDEEFTEVGVGEELFLAAGGEHEDEAAGAAGDGGDVVAGLVGAVVDAFAGRFELEGVDDELGGGGSGDEGQGEGEEEAAERHCG